MKATQQVTQRRRNRPGLFYKRDVRKNFLQFTDISLLRSLCFNKIASLRPVTVTFIKRDYGIVFFL